MMRRRWAAVVLALLAVVALLLWMTTGDDDAPSVGRGPGPAASRDVDDPLAPGDAAHGATDGPASRRPPRPRADAPADGAAPDRATAPEPDTPDVPAAELRITGVVVDRETKEPLAQILVVTEPKEGDLRWTLTSADGSFVFGHAAPGLHDLTAGRSGRIHVASATEHLPARFVAVTAGGEPIRIELTRGASIAGTILDGAGRPVATSVKVDALGRTEQGHEDYARRVDVVVSDPKGRFRIGGLAPGVYDLQFTPQADAPASGPKASGSSLPKPAGAPPDAPAPTPHAPVVVRGVSTGTDALEVRLVAGVPLRGRLVDEHGDPIAWRTIVAVFPTGGRQGGEGSLDVMTKADGTFETVPLAPGSMWEVRAANTRGYMETTVHSLVPGGEPARIVLRRAAELAGRVVDEDGQPVGAGVSVSIVAEGDARRAEGGRGGANTRFDGTFEIGSIGDFTFTVLAGGGRSVWAPAPPVAGVRAGTTDLVLKVRRGVVLSGRLVDAQGRPFRTRYLSGRCESAPDESMPGSTSVDADDGAFVLQGLLPGKVSLVCDVGEVLVDLGTVTAPAEGIVLKLPAK